MRKEGKDPYTFEKAHLKEKYTFEEVELGFKDEDTEVSSNNSAVHIIQRANLAIFGTINKVCSFLPVFIIGSITLIGIAVLIDMLLRYKHWPPYAWISPNQYQMPNVTTAYDDDSNDSVLMAEIILSNGTSNGTRIITEFELSSHNTEDDIWVAIHGNVYNMTSYARSHPGGYQVIAVLVGSDGTEAFDDYHNISILSAMEGYKVGILDIESSDRLPNTTTTADSTLFSNNTTTCHKMLRRISLAEVRKHNEVNDNWMVIDGKIYNMTTYANTHPGGASIVEGAAGTNATLKYHRFHSESLLERIQHLVVGVLFDDATQQIDDFPCTFAASDDVHDDNYLHASVAYDAFANTNISVAKLSNHSTEDDCWVNIHGTVYDLTNFATKHPGGAQIITDLAGTDGTKAFDSYHPVSFLKAVEDDRVGNMILSTPANTISTTLAAENTPEKTTADSTSTSEETMCMVFFDDIQMHNTVDDCWVVLHGSIYDLTQFAQTHPGGASIITDLAGKDATSAFNRFHNIFALAEIQNLVVGEFSGISGIWDVPCRYMPSSYVTSDNSL